MLHLSYPKELRRIMLSDLSNLLSVSKQEGRFVMPINRLIITEIIFKMAERVGFEPTKRFPVYTLSKRAPSTTRPSLLKFLY